MLNNEITDFSYHEFKTDSDNLVKDLSRLFSLGSYSREVKDARGDIIKPSAASIEYNWQIVYPSPNFSLVSRKVNSFEELDSREYEIVVQDQLERITNKATIRCTTLTDKKESLTKAFVQEQIEGQQKEYAQMYLQMYMPKYLCDTELVDPFAQEDGVTIPLCVNPRSGRNDAKVRNYHWVLMRVFDNPNEDFSGPKENVTDVVTGELLEFNSASSEWSKLSWFTDFEEMFLSEINTSITDDSDKIVRVPVSSSLTNKTKIRVMANVHPNRVALSVVGNPNVDYADNRYLISTAYIGAVDSFKDSKKDKEGNFGIFTTSSTVPSIPKQSLIPTETFSGLDDDGMGGTLPANEKWKVYNQSPGKVKVTDSPEPQLNAFISIGDIPTININSADANGTLPGEVSFTSNYKKREIPANDLEDSEGGRTFIVPSSIKTTMGVIDSYGKMTLKVLVEYGNNPSGHEKNGFTYVNIPLSDLKSALLPFKVDLQSKSNSLTETISVSYKVDDLYRFLYKYIEAELTAIGKTNALIPGMYTTQLIRFTTFTNSSYSNYHSFSSPQKLLLGFDEQGELKKVVNKTKRDKYGNVISTDYPKTFGINTANCSTDFAMYKTDSSDFWQGHFLMFSSTEQFMNKHMYGKSAYTNEYFADRIKITHSSEGVRGVLSGFIVIDADSLFAFDELIVNKDFNKDVNKPEETYVYLPITASYCPFANSPNERNGVGLLKGLRYSDIDDETKCESAIQELVMNYSDSFYHTNNKTEIVLSELSSNGLSIEWSTDNPELISID